MPQLSNLWWMPNSVSIGFGTAMKMGSSRRFKWHPTTPRWVSSQLPFTVDLGKSWFILILSKGKLTWHSPIGCGVPFESSWWAHFHDRAKTYADWVWCLSKIGELCCSSSLVTWCHLPQWTPGLCPEIVIKPVLPQWPKWISFVRRTTVWQKKKRPKLVKYQVWSLTQFYFVCFSI